MVWFWPEKQFRQFRFRVQVLGKRFQRFRLPVPVRLHFSALCQHFGLWSYLHLCLPFQHILGQLLAEWQAINAHVHCRVEQCLKSFCAILALDHFCARRLQEARPWSHDMYSLACMMWKDGTSNNAFLFLRLMTPNEDLHAINHIHVADTSCMYERWTPSGFQFPLVILSSTLSPAPSRAACPGHGGTRSHSIPTYLPTYIHTSILPRALLRKPHKSDSSLYLKCSQQANSKRNPFPSRPCWYR